MFDQIGLASEALYASLGATPTAPPALYGCTACGTVRMIAAPTLGTCRDCRSELTVLDPDPGIAPDAPPSSGGSRRERA